MKTRYNVQSFYFIQNDTDNFSVFNALTDKPILSDASASEASDFSLANSPLHPAISLFNHSHAWLLEALQVFSQMQ